MPAARHVVAELLLNAAQTSGTLPALMAAAKVPMGLEKRRLRCNFTTRACKGEPAGAAHKSASTAPASTLSSWSGSPSNTSSAVAGKAASTASIISKSTIDASSMKSTSQSMGCPASRLKARVSGRAPSKRCRVCAAGNCSARTDTGKASPNCCASSPSALAMDW